MARKRKHNSSSVALCSTQVQGFTVQGFRLRRVREMKIKRFEDIDPPAVWRIGAWQPVESVKVERLARELTRKVYCLTKRAEFAKDYGLKRQIQDAPGS